MNAITQNIRHVVVLMFENRSFDHLFGAFPGANGLLDQNGNVKPECYNLADPTQPPGPSNQIFRPLEITPDHPLAHDFDHNFGDGMMRELFGPAATGWQAGHPLYAVSTPPQTWPPTNSGFVSTIAYNADTNGGIKNGPDAMSYYQYGSLRVLHPLASEFVLCDNWFCDMPGNTLLNRFFMHGAQTDGICDDDQSHTLSTPTIFDQITAQGSSWKMYAPWAVDTNGQPIYVHGSRNPQIDSRFLQTIQGNANANWAATDFAADAAAGTLPFYSFLMCWLPLNSKFIDASTETSMHPASDIQPGENYLAAVYNCLRNSPSWNDTLLIVTFDENGGIYDHVVPPAATAPVSQQVGQYWNQFIGQECKFDFTLLGPRIPVLLISPWLRSGIASEQYQNTSILRFLQSLIGAGGLNDRDAGAPSLDSLFAEFGVSQQRNDCPASIAGYPGFPYANGDLSKTCVLAPLKHNVVPAHLVHVAEMYRFDVA